MKSDDTENQIDFLRSAAQNPAQTKQRKLPQKAPEPKEQPDMPKLATPQAQTPQTPSMAVNSPQLNSPLSFGDGPYLGGGGGGAAAKNSDTVPLVRIPPQYPRKAAMAGTQGWVELGFNITATGAVSNVKVLRSQPRRIFDQSAKRALSKWKYRPKMDDGKPVAQKGLSIRLDFKLQK